MFAIKFRYGQSFCSKSPSCNTLTKPQTLRSQLRLPWGFANCLYFSVGATHLRSFARGDILLKCPEYTTSSSSPIFRSIVLVTSDFLFDIPSTHFLHPLQYFHSYNHHLQAILLHCSPWKAIEREHVAKLQILISIIKQ